MTRHVALLRGINVGTAKAVDMHALRACFESLGCTAVRTVLRSGNVVFDSGTAAEATLDGAAIERAIVDATGVSCAVVVVDDDRFREIVAQNPLLDVSADPSRSLVYFLGGVPDDTELGRPGDAELLPERLVVRPHAIYHWCPDGVSKSKVPARFFTSLGVTATGRNLRTVAKLLAMLDAP